MRLVTFNILHGRSPEDDRVDLARFAAAIRTLNADVLALQEVDHHQPRSLGADLTQVAAGAMGAVAHQFVAATADAPTSTRNVPGTCEVARGTEQPVAGYGIALLSRYRATWQQVIRLPTLPALVPVGVNRRAGPVLVKDEPRVALSASLSTPHGELLLVTTHLSFIPAWNAKQLRRLRRPLAEARTPVVLMGDLNMGIRRATRLTGMVSLAAHPTFPVQRPHKQIDHILAHRLSGASHSAAYRLPLSDHRALAVELQPRCWA